MFNFNLSKFWSSLGLGTLIWLQLKNYNSILEKNIWLYMNASGGVPRCAMNQEWHVWKSYERWLCHKYNVNYMVMQSNMTMMERHIRDIFSRTIFFLSCLWHFYDDNCDKTRYHHRCGGLLLLLKKSWQKMGFSSWAGRRRSYMTFFGPSMTEKTVVEARASKISGVPGYGGWSGPSNARFSRTHTRVGARRCALTVPERLHCRPHITEPERSIDGC